MPPSPALGAAHIYSPSLTALRGGRRQFRWPPPRWWTVGGPCSPVGWQGLDCQPSPRTEEHSSLQLCGHLSASCWAPSMCRLLPTIQRETGWWSSSIAASRTPYVPTALVQTGWTTSHGSWWAFVPCHARTPPSLPLRPFSDLL